MAVNGTQVRIGIKAPREVAVDREEIAERKRRDRENSEAIGKVEAGNKIEAGSRVASLEDRYRFSSNRLQAAIDALGSLA